MYLHPCDTVRHDTTRHDSHQAKEMDVISKYHDSKIIHGRYISYLYI
jgi:hypothetical protein